MMAAPAVSTSVELLRFMPQSHRSALLFTALERAAKHEGVDVRVTDRYHGLAPWLMLWGPGAKNRMAPMAQHRAAGGHVVSWDCSYWSRQQKMRVSIDAPHPQAWLMRKDWPSTRLTADPVPTASVWKPTGPVIVAGIGEKAHLQYGDAVSLWEREQIATARARGLTVHYRPKKQGAVPNGVFNVGSVRPIDQVLRGASLVITWHSNVAVDAIRMGIPAICRDGAAAAVCPSEWPTDGVPQPISPELRQRFLQNLAWFQWGTTAPEARGAWQFLQELLS